VRHIERAAKGGGMHFHVFAQGELMTRCVSLSP
jgi:hypothetical protein